MWSVARLLVAYAARRRKQDTVRVRYKKMNQCPLAGVAAVRPLPIRYTPSVTMNRFRRPSLSDSCPKNSAPMTSPIRYHVAMPATEPGRRIADPGAAAGERNGGEGGRGGVE